MQAKTWGNYLNPYQNIVSPPTQVGDGATDDARVERVAGDLHDPAVEAEDRGHHERLPELREIRADRGGFHRAEKLISHEERYKNIILNPKSLPEPLLGMYTEFVEVFWSISVIKIYQLQ